MRLFVAMGAAGPGWRTERLHSSVTYRSLRMDMLAFTNACRSPASRHPPEDPPGPDFAPTELNCATDGRNATSLLRSNDAGVVLTEK